MKSKIIGLGLGVLLVVGFVLTPFARSFFFEDPIIGKNVPDVTLYSTDGSTVSTAELLVGQKSIVFFWATWCPHCRNVLVDINSYKQKLIDDKINLVLIDLGENKKTVLSYLKSNKFEFNVLLDEDQEFADELGLYGVPTLYFIDEKGVVLGMEHSLPDNYLKLFKVTEEPESSNP